MPLDSVPANQIPYVLRRAKALIDTPDKWCQGARRNDEGQLCARGAILVVTCGSTSGPYRLTGPARLYLRLAAQLWAGVEPQAAEPMKDRDIFDFLGFE